MNAIALFSWLRVRLPGVIPIVCLTISVAHGSDGRDVVPDKRIARPIGTLSENPSDAELLRVDMFDQPLVPSRPTTRAENRALASALGEYRRESASLGVDAVGSLERFLASHPDSPWRAVLLVDLGAIYRKTGHFSRALETWQSAWDESKGLTDRNGMAIGDAAIGYLSQFEAYLGRKERLAPLLAEVKARPVRGAAAQWVTMSMRGLSDMIHRPEKSFRCGPLALSRIAAGSSPANPQALNVLAEAQSTPNGLSLTAVQKMSVDAGMNYQMVFRSPGTPAITPAVAHWNVGHYAALLGTDATGRFAVEDPTFGVPIRMTAATLDAEASGYFLVPSGPLPPGWRSVGAEEGERVWGRGDTGANYDLGATGQDEIQAFPGCPTGGCTGWNVEAMTVGLSLRDTPVGYHPPVGPDVRITVSYSQRDVTQPQTLNSTNFGNQWTMNWISHIAYFNTPGDILFVGNGPCCEEIPPQNFAVLYRPGGGIEVFNQPLAPSVGPYSHAMLTPLTAAGGQPGSGGFQLEHPDGAIDTYATSANPLDPSGTGNWLLTSVADPQGNTVTVKYDAQLRIASITDASLQPTTFDYDNTPGGDPFKVQAIHDPFNRTVSFSYDSMGRLQSITDVLGITSRYAYNDVTNPLHVDFVTSLTTPYGVTQFSTGEPSADNLTNCPPQAFCNCEMTKKWVQVTDPLNRTSRVESCEQAPGILPTDTIVINGVVHDGTMATQTKDASSIPTGMGLLANPGGQFSTTYGAYLTFRNTFVWNPVQYEAATTGNGPSDAGTAGDGPSDGGTPAMDYTKAKILHWLHTDDYLATARVLESTKEPLDNRIWYTYPSNSNDSRVLGTSNLPTGVGRVLPDGTTELSVTTRDCTRYGYQPCIVTDPVKRQTTYLYDTNGVDLLTVTNTTPNTPAPGAHNDRLVTFSNYVQHRPQTVTEAGLAPTTLSYTPFGQIKQITPPAPPTYIYNYNPKNQLESIALNASTQTVAVFKYDSLSRLFTAKDATGELITFGYDDADRLTSKTFPDGTSVGYGYTLLDLTSVTDRVGNLTTGLYDADRHLTSSTRSGRVTKYDYYDDGSLKHTTDPRNSTTLYSRDIEGRLQNITYPMGDMAAFTWDTVGRLASDPNATYEYTMDGMVLSATYTNGDTFANGRGSPGGEEMTYDPAYPRLTSIGNTDPGYPPTPYTFTTYAYNPVPAAGAILLGANQLKSVTTAVGDSEVSPPVDVVSYGYDALNRVSNQVVQSFSSSSATEPILGVGESTGYDPLGRVDNISNPLDSFTYGYSDLSARVSGVSSFDGPTETLTYQSLPLDPLLATLSYSGRQTSQFATFDYAYNANGQVNSYTFPIANNLGDPVSPYGYDAWGELKTASGEGPTITYGYDDSGNLASETSTRGRTTTSLMFTYNADDQTLTSPFDASTPVFDEKGNPVSLGGATYTVDSRNRIRSVTKGAQESFFYYDALGHLVHFLDLTNDVVTNEAYLVWCGNRICLSHDANGNLISAYFRQGFITFVPNGTEFIEDDYYYVKDNLGTVNQVWAPAGLGGDMVGWNEYADPYGDQFGDGVQGDFGLAGYFHHAATGLDFAEHRAYRPRHGRWLTRDPIGVAGGMNLYRYADDDPASLSDPNGNWAYVSQTGANVQIAIPIYFEGQGATQQNITNVVNQIQSTWSGNFGGYSVTTAVQLAGNPSDPGTPVDVLPPNIVELATSTASVSSYTSTWDYGYWDTYSNGASTFAHET